MDEIADLIRTLAEKPASEPPLSRPKDLLEQRGVEKAIRADSLDLQKQAEPALPAEKTYHQTQPAFAATTRAELGPPPELQTKQVDLGT